MSTATPNENNALVALSDDRLQVALRAWILWLRGMFVGRSVGDYRWTENNEDTEIFISGSEPDTGLIPMNRPRLIVSRTTGQMLGTSTDQAVAPEFFRAHKTMTDLISFGITIECVSKEGLEAQRLAWHIFRYIPLFIGQIARVGRIHHINTRQLQIGPETPRKSVIGSSPNPEWKSVSIVVPVTIQEVVSKDAADFYPLVVQYMLEVSNS